MKNTDLHTHSYYSDGQISPKELVRLAKKRKIKNIALTDHDSVKGIQEAVKEGKKIGVNVIPGIELRCDIGEILAYYINPKNKELKKEVSKIENRVKKRVKKWCKKLNKNGYKITYEELRKKFPKSKNNLNEFYVLYILFKKGYGTNKNLFKKFSGNPKLKADKIREISGIKAIQLIKKAGGVPVLAHPWIKKAKGLKIIKKLVKAGLKGIEINNGDRAPFRKKTFDKIIKNTAKKYNLIITSGSDYHGDEIIKQKLFPGNHNLGKNNCDEKVVEQLKQFSSSIK